MGHILSAEGVNMTKEKILKVINFVRPQTVKAMHSFLGLTAYFYKHILNYAAVTKSLHTMLATGKKAKAPGKEFQGKNKLLTWNDECIAAFEEIKSAIEQCPLLYFIREDAPIFLNTAASDYGVGAHMFQTYFKQVYYIAFMSKSLTGDQLNWSVKEKESYAIVYALKVFEYLLRGRHFQLFTDHQNLLYLNSQSSQKVIT